MAINNSHWQEAWELFQAAQKFPEAERSAFIEASISDAEVRERVRALLAGLADEDEEAARKPRAPERQPGDRVGRYEIERRIGEGSFGEVWSGRDTELGRRVALKFIAEERRGDTAAARQFLREARAAAALNHPHIVVVHEVLAAESGPVIVMELVDGQPLRELMAQPLVPERARAIAEPVLKALAHAHAAGVVHRDLKPENIMVRADGLVKVLDFGLARRVTPERESQSGTGAGWSAGTLRYMAPEQCQGEAGTAASDVFAAGVILQEMITGVHPFVGATWVDTVHAIVNQPVPPVRGPFEALLTRLLRKTPGDRPSAEEAGRALEAPAAAAPAGPLRRWALSALVTAAGLAAVGWWAGTGRGDLPLNANGPMIDTRLDLGTGVVIDERGVSLSPDGRKLLFHGSRGKDSPARLQVLDFASGEVNEWGGPEGQRGFWSPDGREIAYFAGGKLWRKGYPSGPVREICDADYATAGHWGAKGTIVFARSNHGPILRVPADGGRPVPAAEFEPKVRRQEAPHVLPDGRHFIYWAAESRRAGQLMLRDLEGKEPPRSLGVAWSGAVFLPRPGSSQGALVYRSKASLVALPFDSATNRVIGPEKVLARRTSTIDHSHAPAAASAGGVLVYREEEDRRIQPSLFDRQGHLLEKVAEPKEYVAARPSPDFQRLALIYETRGEGVRGLELYDFRTRVTIPVPQAIEPGEPTWAPDSLKLLSGNGTTYGLRELYRIEAPLGGPPVVGRIPGPPFPAWPASWPAKGLDAVVTLDHPDTSFDVWLLPADGQGSSRPLITAPGKQQRASLSPDGKLLVYMSDETKRPEVWVTPFPPDGRKWKVSDDGGQEPRWRANGREIFFLSIDYALMSVKVEGTPAAPAFAKAERLFGGRSAEPALMAWHFEPAPDGQRFVILTGQLQPVAAPLRLRQHWWAEGR